MGAPRSGDPSAKRSRAPPPSAEVIDLDDSDDDAGVVPVWLESRLESDAVNGGAPAAGGVRARRRRRRRRFARRWRRRLARLRRRGVCSAREAGGDGRGLAEREERRGRSVAGGTHVVRGAALAGKCGNFDVCSNGSSSWQCITKFNGQPYQDHTAHGLEPRPMSGQRFTLKYLPYSDLGDPEHRLGLRNGSVKLSEGGERKLRPGVDGTVKVVEARSVVFTPFAMPPFAGRVETLFLDPCAERVFVLRNFDGACGGLLARRLEGAFGLDVVAPPGGKGTMAKCAAAQGNNCQDNYTKLFPLRMPAG